MNLIDRIHKQRQEIKQEEKMIPTELGNKIIRNFKVPARNNKHVIKRYTKTSKRNNKLHKKGDIKFRKIKDYDDFINNYDLILKINHNKNNVHNDIKKIRDLEKKCNIYKSNSSRFNMELINIQRSIGTKKVSDITTRINKGKANLLKYENFFNTLSRMLNVSTGKQLLVVIQNLRDIKRNSQNNQNDQDNTQGNNDKNSDGDQSDDTNQYHFGKIE